MNQFIDLNVSINTMFSNYAPRLTHYGWWSGFCRLVSRSI